MGRSIVDSIDELIEQVSISKEEVEAVSRVQNLQNELDQLRAMPQQQAVEELKKQLEAKGGELQKVVGERDVLAKEKGEAQQAVEELKQQLEAKGGELQKVVGERDARAKEKGEAQKVVEELRKQLDQASESLAQKESQVQESSEEAELTLLQLHQVQEELEHYFLLTRKQSAMLDSCSQLQKRTASLLSQVRS